MSTAPTAPAPVPLLTEPPSKRVIKPTRKQASQNRREEEKRQKKEAKNKRKPKTKEIIQLVDTQLMDLPFRSSQ